MFYHIETACSGQKGSLGPRQVIPAESDFCDQFFQLEGTCILTHKYKAGLKQIGRDAPL